MLLAGGITDKGRIRRTNEDCFAVDEELRLLVVADGMGGHKAGDVAARVAIEATVDFIRAASALPPHDPPAPVHPFGYDPSLSPEANLIRTAILLANMEVLDAAGMSEDYVGMGTTIVAALVVGDRLAVGHVGDSRLYRLHRRRLSRLTDDDSWMGSSALTNVVGARPCMDVHVFEARLREGDALLLTTDGVHGAVDDGHLERLLSADDDAPAIAGRVVQAALARGSRDNCTAVVARYLPD